MNETFCNFKLNNEKETLEFKIKSHNNEINFPNKENENSNLKLSKKSCVLLIFYTIQSTRRMNY